MFFALAQLVRLPNVCTAWADVLMAWLVCNALMGDTLPLSLLPLVLTASTAFYWGGMVMNDLVDLEEDRRDRPRRPLPAGRVSVQWAWRLALTLFAVGLVCFAAASSGGANLWVGPALVMTIASYNLWMKATWLGPWAMGICRFLNVLLVAGPLSQIPPPLWLAAGLVGIYIVGVTVFARGEATTSDRRCLLLGAALMHLAMSMALGLLLRREPALAAVALLGFLAVVGRTQLLAFQRPVPPTVQAAVKAGILALIGLDAVLAATQVGLPGVAILGLLPVALVMGRWIYST